MESIVVDTDMSQPAHPPTPLHPYTTQQVIYLLHDDDIDEVHQHKD